MSSIVNEIVQALELTEEQKLVTKKEIEDYIALLHISKIVRKVVCDETNNTPETIARGELNITVYPILVVDSIKVETIISKENTCTPES